MRPPLACHAPAPRPARENRLQLRWTSWLRGVPQGLSIAPTRTNKSGGEYSMSSAVPMLVALTPLAQAAIRGREIRLHRFPFRVGRESRLVVVDGALQVMERRKQLAGPPNNDLYLP